MSKISLHDPFGHLTYKLWPKEGLGVNLTIWLLTTKSRKSPRFCCVHVVCDIPLESSWRRLQLCFRPDFNQRFSCKVMGPQSRGILIVRISRLSLGSPGTKWHLGAGPVAKHRVYYKGEGGGFPQVRAVMSFVSPSLPVARPSTKSAPTMH